jgi:peptidoglycan/LPS O-acetylase OafA/YrhL
MVLIAHDADFIGRWTGHHAPGQLTIAGPFGVELFFVLSGFLIGGLLLEIVERGPTLRNLAIFLSRRWLRTLPLYFVWLAVLFVFRPPAALLAWHLIHYATLTQNLLHGMPPGDFFAVSWSLTVEEWFYLLFAAAAISCVAATRRRAAIWMPTMLFLIVPMILRWRVPDSVDMLNGLEEVVVFKLDSIALGVLLAIMLRRRAVPVHLAVLLLAMGTGLIAFVWSGRLEVSAHVFRTIVMSTIAFGWMLCVPAALCWPACGGIGADLVRVVSRYSYGLYIMHYTVLENVHRYLPLLLAIAVGITAPFLLAWLSWTYLEAPILARRPRHGW